MNQPLHFERDGKVVHRLRPVETYLLDERGEPVIDHERPIRSAQVWNLKRSAAGVAEMSAHLGDLAELPEGDLVVDPSIIFDGEGFYGSGDIVDVYMDEGNPSTNYGSNTAVYIGNTSANERRSLFGFAHISDIPDGAIIHSATLSLTPSVAPSSPGPIRAIAYQVTKNWYMSTVTWDYDGISGSIDWVGGEYTEDYQSPSVELPSSSNMSPITFDISMAFKAHYSTNPSDILDRGFLLKVIDSTSHVWGFNSSDYEAAEDRPVLTVTYGSTQFGAHFPKTLSEMADDQIFFERYYASNAYITEIEDDFVDRWNYNDSNPGSKIKVLVNLHCGAIDDYVEAAYKWWEFYESPPPSAANVTPAIYGNFVQKLLEDIETALIANDASAKLEDVIFGVEIGNEEEAGEKWGSGNGYQEGKDFAEYYVEAYNVIHDNWPELEIVSGGSVEETRELSYSSGKAYKFIEGFIDQVKTSGGNTYDLFPDTIAIHGYSAQKAPEYFPSGSLTEWFTRLQELYTICNSEGWLPNFALTEYGWSATHVNASDHDNNWGFSISGNVSSATSQAMFYAREVLMNACMQPFNGIGWKYDFSYHHNMADPWKTSYLDVDDNTRYSVHDFGFFIKETNPPQSRIIRSVARQLFDSAQTPSLSLSDLNNLVVLPTKAETQGSSRVAYCAWKVKTGASTWQEWGAIWEYKWDIPYSNITEATKTFEIPGDYSTRNIELYKFNAAFSDIEYKQTLDHTDTNDIELLSNPTRTKIYVPIVDENPTFLKLN